LTNARILVVDDDEQSRALVRVALERESFAVLEAGDGVEALELIASESPDLVVLDVNLPLMGGFDVLTQMRTAHSLPVIMVTGRDGETDRVLGLELGADDYVTKPYSPRELLARIRAVLRRGAEAPDLDPQVLEAAGVRMDVERHVVTLHGEPLALPLKEFDLLELLLRNAGRVLTRGQLIDRVWGADYVGDTKTLDVHVTRLRAKIEDDPRAPRLLLTVRGLGYRLEG
jgi:two-component system, OmpR family, response regulator RegX3